MEPLMVTPTSADMLTAFCTSRPVPLALPLLACAPPTLEPPVAPLAPSPAASAWASPDFTRLTPQPTSRAPSSMTMLIGLRLSPSTWTLVVECRSTLFASCAPVACTSPVRASSGPGGEFEVDEAPPLDDDAGVPAPVSEAQARPVFTLAVPMLRMRVIDSITTSIRPKLLPRTLTLTFALVRTLFWATSPLPSAVPLTACTELAAAWTLWVASAAAACTAWFTALWIGLVEDAAQPAPAQARADSACATPPLATLAV